LAVIEFVLIIGSDSTYAKVNSLAIDVACETLDVTAPSKSLVKDCLFVVKKFRCFFVLSRGDSANNRMAYP
jgi:hypothetical protein